MLAKLFNNVVLIGADSDIGISIINQLPLSDNAKLHMIGRTKPCKNRFKKFNISTEFEYCDLENFSNVKEVFNDPSKFIHCDLVIFAAGYLPNENSELDSENVRKTLVVNALALIYLLSGFVRIMNDGKKGQILVLSSVASTRPRTKNFTYGASKATLDFYSVGLQNKYKHSNIKITIARPGFIFSKMTSKFKPAPFAIDLHLCAKIIVNGLLKEKKIIYVPKKLKAIMGVIRLLPRPIFDILG